MIYTLSNSQGLGIASLPKGSASLARFARGRRTGRLRGLGAFTAGQGISMAAPIGGVITTAALSTSSVFAGTALASAAGPIGAAVGAVVGLIGAMLAAHAVRAKQAKGENSAMNIGVQGFDSDLKQINAALKAGTIDSSGALQAAQQVIMAGYWAIVNGQIQPGRNGCNTGASCPPPAPAGKNPCTGNIGAACCVGCFDLALSMTNPDGVYAAIQGSSSASGGPYTSNITQVYGSGYGGAARSAYSLDWTPPAAAASGSSAAGSATDALSSITSLIPGVTDSPIVWIAAIAGGIYLFKQYF
jgi:hypothetical protein